MTDAEEQIADLAVQLQLAPAVVAGVCSELARNPDHAQKLELCQKWGLAWPELQRLAEIRPRDLEALGKGLAQQGIMISSLAQGHLAQKLSEPAIVAGMEPKELSTIAKQQSDIALSWAKEAPASMGGGNTFNIAGGSIKEILDLMAQRQSDRPARERVAAALAIKGIEIPSEE